MALLALASRHPSATFRRQAHSSSWAARSTRRSRRVQLMTCGHPPMAAFPGPKEETSPALPAGRFRTLRRQMQTARSVLRAARHPRSARYSPTCSARPTMVCRGRGSRGPCPRRWLTSRSQLSLLLQRRPRASSQSVDLTRTDYIWRKYGQWTGPQRPGRARRRTGAKASSAAADCGRWPLQGAWCTAWASFPARGHWTAPCASAQTHQQLCGACATGQTPPWLGPFLSTQTTS
jgi:hypothetical protein